MIHVIISVSGGNVQETVCNNECVLITVLDYDNPNFYTGKADSVMTTEGLQDYYERETDFIHNMQKKEN